ncbi:MAG: OmpW family outer membrane protein [Gemmatimonadales bacterium]|nr:OmpW family outer membrane protein [Gemmatimonadales bacterium]MDZ4388184.1 OmpW family outer membrane protein [Gemmatimonadales bacterium]
MRIVVLGVLLAAVVGTTAASAQVENPWLIRARGIAIIPDASSSPRGLDVEADGTVELDITRFLTRNIAVELVLASAGHEVKMRDTGGETSLGSVNVLPPTLVLQYHLLPEGKFRPYIGAGGNLTFFYTKTGDLDALDLDESFSWAAQAGFDIPISKRAVFNVDAKYIDMNTSVKSGGTKVFDLDINPIIIGVGIGYRF